MIERSTTDQLVLTPWERVVRRLRSQGWAVVPAAVGPGLLTSLLPADVLVRERLEDATASESGPHCYRLRCPLAGCAPGVRDLAVRLGASLSVSAALEGLDPPPFFNEAVWTL
jgi:hypothetical protein